MAYVSRDQRECFARLVDAVKHQIRFLEVEAQDGSILPVYVDAKVDIATSLLQSCRDYARLLHDQPMSIEEKVR